MKRALARCNSTRTVRRQSFPLPADTTTQAWSQSAYSLGNSTLGLHSFSLGSPSFTAMSPNGNHTYGGTQDITLFGYGGQYYPVNCGHGYLTCTLKSSAPT